MPSGNLVVNPGAEAAPGAPDASQQLPLPGWTVESTFTAVQYGAPDFLTAADGAAVGGGVNFFAGGPGGALSAATQVIDVSGAAAEIDGGKVQGTLSALMGGYATQTDYAAVSATFLNAAGATLGALRLAAVSPGDRQSVTALVARSTANTVPAGTRQISVRIDAVRERGVLQRRLRRQRQSRAWRRQPGLPQDRRGPDRQRQGARPATREQGVRRAQRQRRDPARLDRRHAGGRRRAHLGGQGGRPAAVGEVLRGRLQGHPVGLDHEPRAHRAAGVVSPRRARRGSGHEEAPPLGRRQGQVPHARASTARPPSAARSGSCRTAAPAP